jgi:hypothetical protein
MTKLSHKMKALQATLLTTTFLFLSTSLGLPQDTKTEPTVLVEMNRPGFAGDPNS